MAKEFLQTGNYKRRNLKYGKQKNTYSKEKCVNLEFDSWSKIVTLPKVILNVYRVNI